MPLFVVESWREEARNTCAHETVRVLWDDQTNRLWLHRSGHDAWEGNETLTEVEAYEGTRSSLTPVDLHSESPLVQERFGAERRTVPEGCVHVEQFLPRCFIVHAAGTELVQARWDRGEILEPGGSIVVRVHNASKRLENRDGRIHTVPLA